MIWTENAFLYVFDRICKKHKPWDDEGYFERNVRK